MRQIAFENPKINREDKKIQSDREQNEQKPRVGEYADCKIIISSMRFLFLIGLIILHAYCQGSGCTGINDGCSNCLNGTNICQQCNANYVLNSTVCSPCPTGQYSPGGSATACLSCSNGCLSCTYNASTNGSTCLNCSINYEPSNGGCSQCAQNRYSNGSNSSCKLCPEGCATCIGSFNNSTGVSCNCSVNYTITNGSLCSPCPSGQASAGGQAPCCPIGCATCNSSACLNCSANYYFSNYSCFACPSGSSSVGGNASSCFNCSTGCSSCNSTSCLACAYGYTLNGNSTCTMCQVANCTNCSSSNYCQTCYGNYTLGIFPEISLTICACISPFIITNTNCVCPSKLVFNGSTCLCTTPNCVSCTSEDYCEQCTAGYVSIGPNCTLYCQIPNCTACNVNLSCISCTGNLVPNSNGSSCVSCNLPNCQSCLTNNVCSFCMPGLILTNVDGVPTCLTCNIANCLTCSSNNLCSQCASSYINNNGLSCTLCMPPCATCNPDGSCITCLSPYYGLAFPNGTCFICNVPNCATCNTSNTSSCLACAPLFTLNNSICQPVCSSNCANCSSNTLCLTCNQYYYVNASSSCALCNNTPQCLSCNSSNPGQCLICASGFYLDSGLCYACPIFCAACTSASYCTVINYLYYANFVLVPTSNSTILANCDPGCFNCSSSNPMFCLECGPGYYISNSTPGFCVPCTLASNCNMCSTSNPSQCLTCYPGSVMTANYTCLLCPSSCATCNSSNVNQCTSCIIGFTLINSTCVNSSNCGFGCASCSVSGKTSVCSQCILGWVLNSGNCVPCQAGCGVCSNSNLGVCLSCLPGYYSNVTGGCSQCSQYCLTCTINGCSVCEVGYSLLSNFTCVASCLLPCATCDINNPSMCTSCIYGFVFNHIYASNCGLNNSCNSNEDCTYCPPGTVLFNANTIGEFVQTCTPCQGYCARCNQNNTALCTACYPGLYLNQTNSSCLACPTGCFNCSNPSFCFTCNLGYIPSIVTSNIQPITCIACLPPCVTCLGSISNCLTCEANFTLQGTNCISNFNFQVVTVLNAQPQTFNQNYLQFLNAIASAIQETLNSITVLSVVYGSVTVTMLVNSEFTPNSTAAISQQSQLQSALSGTVAGMQVSSTTITTNGGKNGGGDDTTDSDSGLSTTTIIIISIFCPILLIALAAAVVMVVHTRRKKQLEMQAMELNTMRESSASSQRGKKLLI